MASQENPPMDEDMDRSDSDDLRRVITQEEGSKFMDIYNESGVMAIAQIFQEKVNAWEAISVEIAVTGETGSGKSSFINAIRGLTAYDAKAAKVGVTETTTEKRAYPFPTNRNVVMWDLPGVGSTSFPLDEYLKKMKFGNYDFFIIVSNDRMRNNDISLAKEIRKLDRKFYYLRSKIDSVLISENKCHPKTFDDKKTIQLVRDEAKKILVQQGLDEIPIFLIDNYDPTGFDFPELMKSMLEDLVDIKRDVFLYNLNLVSVYLLEEKIKTMKMRIWRIAVWSAAKGASEMSRQKTFDKDILLDEITFYRKQLGLDDESLRSLATMVNKDFLELKSEILSEIGSTENITLQMLSNPTEFEKELPETINNLLPFLTKITGGITGVMTSQAILYDTLMKLKTDGERVLAKAFGK